MPRRIVILQGHPDCSARHFGHALADAYAQAAEARGHEVRRVEIARLDFPVLRTVAEWEGELPAGLREAQNAIAWADHLVVIFPLWLGTMPALVKAFFEQVLRPSFTTETSGGRSIRKLKGKSARVVVTMGMPAFAYRWFYFATGVRCLERNVLKFCGIRPVRETFIGLVESGGKHRQRALDQLRTLGVAGR